MNLKWTIVAEAQLENIYNFIKTRDEIAATRVYNDILDEASVLVHFPYMAPVEPVLSDFPEMYRSLAVKRNYKVTYHVENDEIIIVAVFDCRQRPGRLREKIRR
ncbi:MAG: type II toxin-antitoxin system RelE/ParE family toxin [Odoribacteraceae bacterium]|jgi:plasmid stabilization system protein ParE|nr:type II toxin-antitoxin system RelE/ParE family toxin [Odoribacteraceae bacterium]